MTLLLTRLVRLFQRRQDVSFSAWLRALPPEELNRWFLRMHELLGIDSDEVPDVHEMSDREFDDYIARLRRSKGLQVGL